MNNIDHGTATMRLNRPSRLYGREEAIQSMVNVFEATSSGQGCLMLVPGYSGVGKTALVQELKTPVAERNGFFCQGKFNQFQHSVPYFAIQQAVTDLLEQLAEVDEDHLAFLKQELHAVVGDLGQLLIDFSPGFASLLDEHPQVANISPQEARHRFITLLQNTLKVFCKPDHPLVMFIDDWQWADSASLDVLQQLEVGSSMPYFLLIAAYRDNEVNEKHPFSSALRELRLKGTPKVRQKVEPLDIDDIQRFAIDALPPAVNDMNGLIRLIHDRTKGVPFFMHAFLEYMYDFGSLQFNREDNCWDWKEHCAGGQAIPDNVVTLFAKRFQQYSNDLQRLLFLSSSLGSSFSLMLLSIVSGYDQSACYNALKPEIEKGYLIAPRLLQQDQGTTEAIPSTLRFVHDRVQQAAYELVPKESLAIERLAIGRVLLASLEESQIAYHLFEITEHMNAGRNLLTDQDERLFLLKLNLQAGRKAISATAYQAALDFHRIGGELLANEHTSAIIWKNHHDLTMSYYLDWAETEFLEGDQSQSEKLIKTALAHAKTPLEKAEAQRVLIVHYTLLARYPEAIAAGKIGLEALGISLPTEDYEKFRDLELKQVRLNIRGRPVDSFFDLPTMTDPEKCKATQLLTTLGPPCYRAHQRLWSVLVPKIVNLVLQHGNMPEVGYSHTALAGLLIWVDDGFSLAREFKNLSIELMDRTFTSPSDQSVFYLMIGSSARHWFNHMKRCSQDYADAYDTGSRFGNLQYAAYAFGHNMYCRFFQGINLESLRRETDISLAFSRTRHNQWAIDLLEGGCHVIDEFTGDNSQHQSSPAWEKKYLSDLDAHNNIQVCCIYNVLRSFQLFVMRDSLSALEFSNEAEKSIHTVGSQGLLPWPEHMLVRFMILADLSSGKSEDTRKLWQQELEQIESRFAIWAQYCPENYTFKLDLARAEIARLDCRDEEAITLLEKAIFACESGGFIQWQAVANERAALFWESRGVVQLAQVYWQQAYACFEEWGARAKTMAMENRLREQIANAFPSPLDDRCSTSLNSICNSLMSKRLQFLRYGEEQSEESSKRKTAENQAKELSHATARLRQEVAHRKAVEEELRSSIHMLNATGRMAKVGGWKLYPQTGKLEWTEQVYRIHEVDASYAPEVNSAINFYHPDDIPVITDAVDNALRDGTTFDLELRIITARQNERWVRATCEPEAHNGQVVCLNGTFQDITEAKATAEELSQIFTMSLDLICVTDIETFSFIRVNPAFTATLGYDTQFFLEKKLMDIVHPDDQEQTSAELGNLHSDKRVVRLVNRCRHKEGGWRWLSWIANAIPEQGVAYVVARDVTENKRAEAALEKARDAADAANRSKSIFLANMSHEIRTPLNGVIGMLQLMQTTPLDDEQEEFIDTALQSSRRLNQLLADILDLSRVEAGRMIINDNPFDFNDMANTIAQLFTPVARQKGLKFTTRFDLNIPAHQTGDTLRLQQVLTNLIGNAIKFTDAGEVSLEACFIEAIPASKSRILFIVSDTGIGIPENMQDKLFDSFTQAEGDYKRQYQGAGLGLAISRQLVKLMGGSICVSSEEGVGSCFHVSIPCRPIEPSQTAALAPSVSKSKSGLNILLAEDDHVSRVGMERMLTKLGHSVDSVEDGQKVLQYLSKSVYDAIIMDIQMPVLDGVDATIRIRDGKAGEHVRDIPIIAMTAYAMAGDRERFLEAGMSSYIAKPVEYLELQEVMEDIALKKHYCT